MVWVLLHPNGLEGQQKSPKETLTDMAAMQRTWRFQLDTQESEHRGPCDRETITSWWFQPI